MQRVKLQTASSERKNAALYFILSIVAALFFPSLQAQDVLVGLTSNGGPEGKGTMFSMKTTGANFSILKGFADWGSCPAVTCYWVATAIFMG
jgi:hypothetical protein